MTLRRHRGFTILELMIVVVIIGVLAAIALVAFSKYKRRAVRSEVASVLGAISLRQETYRSEMSAYKDCPSGEQNVPALGSGGAEPVKKPVTKPACWTELGLQTDPGLYCSYSIYGGTPDSWPGTLSGADQGAFPTAPKAPWYVGKAECDLDGKGSPNSIFYRTQDSSGFGERNPDM